jgi:hypothetical protein
MATKILVIFLGLAALCNVYVASPASSQDDTEAIKERRSMAKFAADCPPGLWCGKKRALDERGANKKSLDERLSMAKFAADCPPGLWCGKKRGLNEQVQSKKSVDKLSMTKFAGDCPPGLWCGKKRQIGEDILSSRPIQRPQSGMENFNPQAEEISPSKGKGFPNNMKLFRRSKDDCPPGLWCGKKRSASKGIAKRYSTICPPGLWCGK